MAEALAPSAPTSEPDVEYPTMLLMGLKSFARPNNVEAALRSLGVQGFVGVVKKPATHIALVGFPTSEACQEAIKLLVRDPGATNSAFGSKKRVVVREADSNLTAESLAKGGKRSRANDEDGRSAKRSKHGDSQPEGEGEDEDSSTARTIHDATTPLLGLPYAAQLFRKQEQTIRAAVRMIRAIRSLSAKNLKGRLKLDKMTPDKILATSRPSITRGGAAAARSRHRRPGKTVSSEVRALHKRCLFEHTPPEFLALEILESATALLPGISTHLPKNTPEENLAATESVFGPLGDVPIRDMAASGRVEVVPGGAAVAAGRLHVSHIVPSPVVLGFRNKCNLTIGYEGDDHVIERTAVGFRVGSFTQTPRVGPVADSAVTPFAVKAVAEALRRAICSTGILPQWSDGPSNRQGVWRMATVRVSDATGEVMLVLEMGVPDPVYDAVCAAVTAQGPEPMAPESGSPLPPALSHLPPELHSAVLSIRDQLWGHDLSMEHPGTLPETPEQGLPSIPQELTGGGSDLRVASLSSMLVLQSSGMLSCSEDPRWIHTPDASPASSTAAATNGAASESSSTPEEESVSRKSLLAEQIRQASVRAAQPHIGAAVEDFQRAGLHEVDKCTPSSDTLLGLHDGRVSLTGRASSTATETGASSSSSASRSVRLASLWIQVAKSLTHVGSDSDTLVRVAGVPVIHDKILGRIFRISPSAFFQTNTLGACRLYGAVRDFVEGSGAASFAGPPCPALLPDQAVPSDALWDEKEQWVRDPRAGPGPGEFSAHAETRPLKTATTRPRIILDLFCGSGTIGIALARPGIDAIVGVELNEAAVSDARLNAEANGFDILGESSAVRPGAALYRASRAEAAMHAVFTMAGLERDSHGCWQLPASATESFGGVRPAVIAVVDPPRAGLAAPVIHALRACTAISRLVYVSCNPFGTFPGNASM
jgi:hypothetical protein